MGDGILHDCFCALCVRCCDVYLYVILVDNPGPSPVALPWRQRSVPSLSEGFAHHCSLGTAQQTLAQSGIRGDIDSRPRHGQCAIDDGLVSSRGDTVRCELRLMIHRWQ
jgi:hypothetical protein